MREICRNHDGDAFFSDNPLICAVCYAPMEFGECCPICGGMAEQSVAVHSRGQGEYARALYPKDLLRPRPQPAVVPRTAPRLSIVGVLASFLPGAIAALLVAAVCLGH